MEIITQELPTSAELLFVPNTHYGRYVYEPKTYSYFLNLMEQEFDSFLYKSKGVQPPQQEGRTPAERYHDYMEWERLRIAHVKVFNRNRQRYHIYNGQLYFYTPMLGNVGHEVEAVRLDMNDIQNLLNEAHRSSLPSNGIFNRLKRLFMGHRRSALVV